MNPRLVITLIVDNSAAMQGDRFTSFKSAFDKCLARIKEANPTNLDLEIIAYDEFSPKVLMSYKTKDFNCGELQPYKMPFLGKAISTAVKDLSQLNEKYGEKEVPIYKPWFFILTDAYSFDDVDEGVNAMKQYFAENKVLYMPFLLSQRKIPSNIEPLAKVKSFMRIKDNAYEEFFDWFYNMAYKRATTPKETPVKFDRADFEGWAIL